jgi:pseudouridine-5'-phosphate glycosidase
MRPIASQSSLVALESAAIFHALPYPRNLRLAVRLGEVVREGSVMRDTGNSG